MSMMPQQPITAAPETGERRRALGLLIAASVAIALWAAIFEAVRLFG
jgi:hypothetical protein